MIRRLLRKLLRPIRSVRARATAVAVVIVGGALAAGALGLLATLHGSMTEGVETTARAQLNDVTSLVRLGGFPTELPAGRGDTFTQVVGPDGKVIATSATLLVTQPISRAHPGEEGTVIGTIPTLAASAGNDADGPYLLLGQQIEAPLESAGGTGLVTVYVAASLHPVDEATTTVGIALAIGLPLLVILVGALVWLFGGRALRPVEAIRAEVSDISGHDLHRRVPEPDSGDEVARLAQTMNEMLDRLETASDAQRRFVSDASHELRSPLAVLQATLEVALAQRGKADWRAVAEDALDETRRLHRLVEDLLTLARSADDTARDRWSEVDLDEIVMREAHRRRTAGGPAFDLRKVSGGRVLGHADQLARVVVNLIDNAQRHASSRVSIRLSTLKSTVTLVVADDGSGIAAMDRERVFERFARTDEARNQDEGGTGLGLAIAREIVEAHHGSIRVDEYDGECRLIVDLPAAPDPFEEGGAGPATRAGTDPSSPRLASPSP